MDVMKWSDAILLFWAGEGRHERICTYLHMASLEKIGPAKNRAQLDMKIIFRPPC